VVRIGEASFALLLHAEGGGVALQTHRRPRGGTGGKKHYRKQDKAFL
jgi:hypothetical protein